MYARRKNNTKSYIGRVYFLVFLLLFILVGLLARIFYLGVIDRDFLLKESASRSVRTISIPVHRGKVVDRNNEPLAVSVPVDTVWANPKLFSASPAQLEQLSKFLNIPSSSLKNKIDKNQNREFVYLQRRVTGRSSDGIKSLNIPGVFLQTEYQRYYPEAEVAGQLTGFTNIDDQGQEGLELAYNSWLQGVSGKMRVVKDRLGNVIENLNIINDSQPGRDLVVSIDRRIQYLAYQELKATVEKYNAEAGTVVVMAVKTGEVLAMMSVPTCDPNDRKSMHPNCYRNRAITDLFEPGSTIKPFSVASVIESGKYTPTTVVDTNPGHFKIENHIVYDDKHRNNGVLTVTGVLQKSSDIGVAKMILSLPPNNLLNMLQKVGFGQSTQSGFPGEVSGVLPDNLDKRPFVLATLGFGYSISTSAIQLARAYTILASGGIMRPVSLLKLSKAPVGVMVMKKELADQILNMMRSVVELGGSGTRAKIHGYTVAGKTGTAYIAKPQGGYYKDRYHASFVGVAPVSDPQLVVAVVIKNPRGQYHGGMVAAPAFSSIMEGALRMLNIAPDDDEVAEGSADAGGSVNKDASRVTFVGSAPVH